MKLKEAKIIQGGPSFPDVGVSTSGDQLVHVQVDTEGGSFVVAMRQQDADRAQQLLKAARHTGEWPDEVNKLINRSKKIKTVGIINTMGDGWGWYRR